MDMDPDFLDKLSKISLTENEELDIAMQVNHRKEILEECSLSMLRRFMSDKPINLKLAKNILCSVWLLQFKFSLEIQLKWVVDNGPWCFDNHLLLLRRWEKGLLALNVSFPSIQLMKRDFVNRVIRTQMSPNSCLDICINKGTSSVRVITGVVPAITPSMPKLEHNY